MAMMLAGMYVNVRGQMLEGRSRQLKSKELAVKAVIYGQEVMEEEDDMGEMDDEKALLAIENNKQMADWQKQMRRIKRVCGQDVYERVLFDAALARNLASFSVIGDPVNYMKPFVDGNYKEVARHWGGGYPRVLPVVLLKTYKKPEGAEITNDESVARQRTKKSPEKSRNSPKKHYNSTYNDHPPPATYQDPSGKSRRVPSKAAAPKRDPMDSTDEELNYAPERSSPSKRSPEKSRRSPDRRKQSKPESDTIAPYTDNDGIDSVSDDSDYAADDNAFREL